jgi:hypothetical protein
MKGRAPLSARVWCDALLARDRSQLNWLAHHEPDALSVINDEFLAPSRNDASERVEHIVTWAVRQDVELDRIRFLVQHCGSNPRPPALYWAIQQVPTVWTDGDWELVDFLELECGVRLDMDRYRLEQYYELLLKRGDKNNPRLWEFLYRYRVPLSLYNMDYDSLRRHINAVHYRVERARGAALILSGLHKRRPDLCSRDVASLLGRTLLAEPRLVVSPAWGNVPVLRDFAQKLFYVHPSDTSDKFVFLWFLLLLFCCCCCSLLGYFQSPLVVSLRLGEPAAAPCTTMTCGAGDKGLAGPMGPPGPVGPMGPPGVCLDDFTVSKGSGIQIPGGDLIINNNGDGK